MKLKKLHPHQSFQDSTYQLQSDLTCQNKFAIRDSEKLLKEESNKVPIMRPNKKEISANKKTWINSCSCSCSWLGSYLHCASLGFYSHVLDAERELTLSFKKEKKQWQVYLNLRVAIDSRRTLVCWNKILWNFNLDEALIFQLSSLYVSVREDPAHPLNGGCHMTIFSNKQKKIHTGGNGDLDLDRDLQKVPETTHFKIHTFLLPNLIQEPWCLFHVRVTISNMDTRKAINI